MRVVEALQASEDQLRGLINTAKLLENEVGSTEETDAGRDPAAARSSVGIPEVSAGSPPSVPPAESAGWILRGAGGRRTSWADGGSAEAAAVEAQINDANARENSSPLSVAEMSKKLEQEQDQQQQQEQRAPPSRYCNNPSLRDILKVLPPD